MIRLQDIADMAGVSRTTVSNVIRGDTKRVSQKTIDRIKRILDEEGYVPKMASMMLVKNVSKLIGVVLGYSYAHGMSAVQDPFVGELLGTIEREAEKSGYFIMLIGGEDYKNVIDIASRWDVDGLIVLGYTEKRYRLLSKKLNKKMVLIDTYSEQEYTFYNVGIDDFSGGYQIGEYLYQCGYHNAVYVAETEQDSDYYRWLGFKQAMETYGRFCSKSRYIVVGSNKRERLRQYKELIPTFMKAGAVSFSSDYTAIEAINLFSDHGVKVPDDISVVGFDDSIFAEIVRPKLTTVHQDIREKATTAFRRLMQLINGEEVKEKCVKNPVKLIIRDSVKSKK